VEGPRWRKLERLGVGFTRRRRRRRMAKGEGRVRESGGEIEVVGPKAG